MEREKREEGQELAWITQTLRGKERGDRRKWRRRLGRVHGEAGGKLGVRYPSRQTTRSCKEEGLNSAQHRNLKIEDLVGAYRVPHSTEDAAS